MATWNPFIVERLALGQWALIWAYAALFWLILAVARGRGRAGWLGRSAALAAASITPTGGLIAAVSAVVVAWGMRRPRREQLALAALAAVVQLPWLLPALVSTAAATSDPAGVSAFSARAEHAGGPLLSLIDGGAIWDAEVVPISRSGALPWVWLAALVAAAAFGMRQLAGLLGRRLVIAVVVLAGAGLALALLPSLPGGGGVVRVVIAHVPGAGLLRDSQKWVLPVVLLEALLVGAALDRLWQRLRVVPWRIVLVVFALALPAIVLPDGAATLRPTIDPVSYPADWRMIARRIHGGDAAVLPWGSYRSFTWLPGRSVLDPAPRLLPVPTVVDDRIAVSGHLLAGEDPRAHAVGLALVAGTGVATRLAQQGIRWVVVEHGTPGAVPDLRGLRPDYRGADVSLYEVPGSPASVSPSAVRIAVVVCGDVLAGLVLVALIGSALIGWPPIRRMVGK